jgi:hypothetical protein
MEHRNAAADTSTSVHNMFYTHATSVALNLEILLKLENVRMHPYPFVIPYISIVLEDGGGGVTA